MTSVVDLRDGKDYTEERRASVAVYGENVHVAINGRLIGHAEGGREEGPRPTMEMQGLSCLWSCHCSVHFALFNNLTNKLGLLFCSCCAVNCQQGWLAHPWICLCFLCKAWVSLQLFFIFGWKSLKIKIQYECQKLCSVWGVLFMHHFGRRDQYVFYSPFQRWVCYRPHITGEIFWFLNWLL